MGVLNFGPEDQNLGQQRSKHDLQLAQNQATTGRWPALVHREWEPMSSSSHHILLNNTYCKCHDQWLALDGQARQ